MYLIYYTDNCDSFHFDKQSFTTLADAQAFCDNYVKDDTPYDWRDVPDRNNHYCLEVIDEDNPEGDSLYRTKDFYKD